MADKTKLKVTIEPGRQEVLIEKEFDAPRDLVFEAFTDAKLRAQWFGPRRYTTVVKRLQPWSGGAWRFVQTDQDGNEFAFHGVIHELTTPERIIETFEFEGLPEKGHVVLQTARYSDLPGGRTRLLAQALFQSSADRDAMVSAGMESGMREGYDRLDELLEKLKAKKKKAA